MKNKGKLVTLVVLAVMWFVAASLLTFRGPFQVTGNGTYLLLINIAVVNWFVCVNASTHTMLVGANSILCLFA